MKSILEIFVVLPLELDNILDVAAKLAHIAEGKLDTYCKLTPIVDKAISPLDYLSYSLLGMSKADVVVFTKDWRSSKECSLLHAIAMAYELFIMELDENVFETTELKACPFCGGKATIEQLAGDKWIAECGNCCCKSQVQGAADDAAAAWNRRVSDQQ